MSVSMQDVRQALNELGRLRFGEMRVEDAMHQIVQTTHAIFSVDGAALMLADAEHNLLNAAVSDARMKHLEELQIRHQEGPCIAAFEDKELVRAEDLSQEMRWPSFSQHAVARGVRAVLAWGRARAAGVHRSRRAADRHDADGRAADRAGRATAVGAEFAGHHRAS